MNDSTEYAKMLEIPVSSCEYIYKRKRRLFGKKKIIKKVNDELARSQEENKAAIAIEQNAEGDNLSFDKPSASRAAGFFRFKKRASSSDNGEKEGKRTKKFDFVTVQVAVIFVLVIAIIMTNIFWDNSGMNNLFRAVFGTENSEQDTRVYSEFELVSPVKSGELTVENGIMSFKGECALYPVCNGKISKIEKAADGTYTVTINHSDSFKSVTEGAQAVYFEVGENVDVNIPVGYIADGGKTYLYNDGTVLDCFAVSGTAITWNK